MARCKQLSAILATIVVLCGAVFGANEEDNRAAGVSAAPVADEYTAVSELPGGALAGNLPFALETSDENSDKNLGEVVVGSSRTDRPSHDDLLGRLAYPRSSERIYLLRHALLI